MTKPTWYTVAETAARLGVSRQRVHILMKRGRLPACQPNGEQHPRSGGKPLWLIEAKAVDGYQRRKTGRPRRQG